MEAPPSVLIEAATEEAMSKIHGHDPQGRGWNRPASRCDPVTHDDGLETIVFTGENFLAVHTFLRGLAYLLGPGAMLIDAPDRAFLVRTGDVVLRYPNGTLGRHRPPKAVSPSAYGL